MYKLQTFFIKASAENPSIIIITGDFNARSPLLWADESTQTHKGKELAVFCTLNCLEQLVKEPTVARRTLAQYFLVSDVPGFEANLQGIIADSRKDFPCKKV